jgi:hypothetical protein
MDEYKWLEGAKIIAVTEGPIGLNLVLRLAPGIAINGSTETKMVEVEVWADEEGNGPGYLALLRAG